MVFTRFEELPANGRLFGFGLCGLDDSSLVLENGEIIVSISCGAYHTALLCASGKVYMMGNNAIGQLGLGTDVQDLDSEDIKTPRLLENNFDNDIVAQVSCGGFHTLFRTVTGRVFACGDNYYGQLGLGYNTTHTSPFLIPRLEVMAQVAAGGSHSAALAVSGQVYVWGSNGWGELGFGHRGGAVRSPTLLAINSSPVASISCGSYHNTFITVDGALYVCGGNYSGQLGIEIAEESSAPKLVKLTSPVVQAACGARHTVVLTESGDVWAWGDNEFGQVGTPAMNTAKPRLILFGQKIAQVACGDAHTVLLSDSGRIWSFGQGKYRQLGFDDTCNKNVPTIVRNIAFCDVSLIACGASMTLAFSSKMSTDDPDDLPPLVEEQTEAPVSRPTSPACLTAPAGGFTMLKFIQAALTCPKCGEYLVPPIFLCEFSHNVCKRCSSAGDGAHAVEKCAVCGGGVTSIRNNTLETLNATLDMPCKDCGKSMSAAQRARHNADCAGKQVCCPVDGADLTDSCHWVGPGTKLSDHALTSHREHLWMEPVHSFVQPVLDGSTLSEIISAFGQTFVFCHRYDVESRALLLAVRCVSAAAEASRTFAFEFSVGGSNDVDRMVFRRRVGTSRCEANAFDAGVGCCVRIPAEMFDGFAEDNQLRRCTLAIVTFDQKDAGDAATDILNQAEPHVL